MIERSNSLIHIQMLEGAAMENVAQGSIRDTQVEEILKRSASKMKQWGITVTYLSSQLGVSRQYAWQVMYHRTMVSHSKALQVESTIDAIITHQSHVRSFGDRLRAARISKGLTLREVADIIGYSWVGVERWEKNVCLPKPGVLWHLQTLYGVDKNWMPPGMPQDMPNPPLITHWETQRDQRRVA